MLKSLLFSFAMLLCVTTSAVLDDSNNRLHRKNNRQAHNCEDSQYTVLKKTATGAIAEQKKNDNKYAKNDLRSLKGSSKQVLASLIDDKNNNKN